MATFCKDTPSMDTQLLWPLAAALGIKLSFSESVLTLSCLSNVLVRIIFPGLGGWKIGILTDEGAAVLPSCVLKVRWTGLETFALELFGMAGD